MEPLPDLHTLTDTELQLLPRQLQDITLKALDGFGAEMQAGNLTLEQINAKSDQLMRWTTAQQELIYAEQMRRSMIKNRKRSLVTKSIVILAIIALIAVSAIKTIGFNDAL